MDRMIAAEKLWRLASWCIAITVVTAGAIVVGIISSDHKPVDPSLHIFEQDNDRQVTLVGPHLGKFEKVFIDLDLCEDGAEVCFFKREDGEQKHVIHTAEGLKRSLWEDGLGAWGEANGRDLDRGVGK